MRRREILSGLEEECLRRKWAEEQMMRRHCAGSEYKGEESKELHREIGNDARCSRVKAMERGSSITWHTPAPEKSSG